MDPSSRDESSTSYTICTLCSKKFGCIKLLNRHKKRIHKIVAVSKECRIICPMCDERNQLKSHDMLQKHLEEKHGISIELLTLRFVSLKDYESWKQEEKIETSYSVQRTNRTNDYKEVGFICNRSDSKGYIPKYKKRTEKSGGTIKIQGMCPSQLICRLYHNGTISVRFWKTHAGHDNELKSLHLSTSEKDIIVEKLKSGVPVDRILEDARKTQAPELQRINLINRNDITYMTKKHNINKKRDPNEMVAAALKVQEWNAKGQKFVFFYKPEGETSIIKPQKQEEIAQFLQEKYSRQVSEELMDQNSMQVRRAQFKNWTDSLNNDIFNKFMEHIQGAIRKADKAQHKVTNKRKMETQEYFPTNKRRKEPMTEK